MVTTVMRLATAALISVVVGVFVDFLQRLSNQSADPNAHVGSQTVHQSETGDGFEFVNVELRNTMEFRYDISE